MSTSFSFILLMLLTLLYGCNKEKSKKWTEVKITAKNYMTGEPISDINCGVLTIDEGIFNDETVILDESPMENGIYAYGFKAANNKTYWAEANFDITRYYTISFSNYMNLQNSEVNQFDFELVDPAYLNIDLVNSNCENENDKLHYRYYFKKNQSDPDYIYLYNFYWENQSKDGCINNTTVAYQRLPAGYYTIEWSVERTSGTTYGSDTFTVMDSTTYLLEY